MKAFLLNKKRSMFIVCFVLIFVASVFVFQAFALNGENGTLVDNTSSNIEEQNKEMELGNQKVQKEENEIINVQENVTVNEDSAKTQITSSQIITKKQQKINSETVSKIETPSQIVGIEPTKNITVSGKECLLYFDWLRKASYPDENDLLVYKNADLNVEIDSKTKEVIRIKFYNQDKLSTTEKITEEKAKETAKLFAEQFHDLSKYDKIDVGQNDAKNYVITFMKTICGVKTSQRITIVLNDNNTVRSMYKSADMFENIDVSKINITEEQIKQQIYDKNKDNEKFSCKFQNIVLVVKDSKIQAEVCYWELDENGDYLIGEHAIAVDYIIIE